MVSGTASLRIVALVATAAILTGLVQRLLPQMETPDAAPAVTAAITQRPTPRLVAAERELELAPRPSIMGEAPPPAAEAPASEEPDLRVAEPGSGEPQPVSLSPGPAAAAAPAAIPEPQPAEPPVAMAAAEQPAAEPMAGNAVEEASPETGNRVDLNTGSIGELNALGAGSIGRAVTQKRPYRSVAELLAKKVLRRSTYDRIKDQVTVR